MVTEPATLFLVDDDPSVLKSLGRALSNRGINVEVFDSALAFIDKYEVDQPGCLVLDLSMPGINGLELQAELNSRSVLIPVIFITGHGDIPQSVQALKAGAVDFLEKPLRMEILLQRIEVAFEQDRNQRMAKREEKSIQTRFTRLTAREIQVMQLLVSGAANRSSKEIARELDISHRTVDQHRARVMEKTQARSVSELVELASRSGYLPLIND